MISDTNNMSGQAYSIIKNKIMNLDYAPGVKISTTSISNDIELGKTPVREALLRLSQEGLVDMIPQSGAYASKINLQNAQEARFTRELIETEIMQEAATLIVENDIKKLSSNLAQQTQALKNRDFTPFFQLDNDFHHYFYTLTNHELTWNWLQLNSSHLYRFRRLRIETSHLQWQTLITQHQELLNATAQHDLTDIRFHELTHIRLMLSEKNQVKIDFPDYFI